MSLEEKYNEMLKARDEEKNNPFSKIISSCRLAVKLTDEEQKMVMEAVQLIKPEKWHSGKIEYSIEDVIIERKEAVHNYESKISSPASFIAKMVIESACLEQPEKGKVLCSQKDFIKWVDIPLFGKKKTEEELKIQIFSEASKWVETIKPFLCDCQTYAMYSFDDYETAFWYKLYKDGTLFWYEDSSHYVLPFETKLLNLVDCINNK